MQDRQPEGATQMATDYLRQQEEDARRRHAAMVERHHDQQERQRRAAAEQRWREQIRAEAADEARRQRADLERRRPRV
jgi:hypothetical protein